MPEEKTEIVDQYWGPDKIRQVILDSGLAEKTYLGKDRVIIDLEDGKMLYTPKEVFDACVTPVASDLTELRECKVVPVVEKILAIITEAELTNDEITYAVSKLKMSIDDVYEKGAEILWGKGVKLLNLYDVEKIFRKENQKNETKNGVGSGGGLNTAEEPNNPPVDKRKINDAGQVGKSSRAKK